MYNWNESDYWRWSVEPSNRGEDRMFDNGKGRMINERLIFLVLILAWGSSDFRALKNDCVVNSEIAVTQKEQLHETTLGLHRLIEYCTTTQHYAGRDGCTQCLSSA